MTKLKKFHGARLTEREKGNVTCKLNKKNCPEELLLCILTYPTLPPSTLPVPYSSPATHLRPSLCPPPHLYKQLSGGFGRDRLNSLWSCCGHVASSSNHLCVHLPRHPFLFYFIYNIQPPVHTQLPLLQLFIYLLWISVGWCAGSCISVQQHVLEAPDGLSFNGAVMSWSKAMYN